MTADVAQAREAIRRCREHREASKVEAVLRSEFLSRLRLIFPAAHDESWINHYSTGTEAHTKVGKAGGKTADRFIDNLIGCTSIEYEADLRIPAKRAEGFAQVKDHATGLIRGGVAASQVRGILSDTVEWYAYDVALAATADPATCTPDDIVLSLVDELQLTADDDPSAERLIAFVRRHLAREQSRPLKADLLALDLGLDSGPYQRSAAPLLKLVSDGRAVAAALRPILESFARVSYPEWFAPGALLGPFIGLCQQREGTPNEILSVADRQELRALLDYANLFHHDTNAAWQTAIINDHELLDFARRALRFTQAVAFSKPLVSTMGM
jgi:hypothetical protein